MSVRIAMWSGPRNISTAMMRAWENRPDTEVWDEPLYGHYLASTGLDHPDADAVISAQSSDWRVVAKACTGPAPGRAPIFFQKHMTHHLLPHIERQWLTELHNCLLIRDPAEVLASYIRTRPNVTAQDLGVQQQAELADFLTAAQGQVVILESSDVLRDPAGMLEALCERVGVAFDTHMLSWPAGRRDSDGVWAPHWYASVWQSTGFEPYRRRDVRLAPEHLPIVEACRPHYERLHAARLRA